MTPAHIGLPACAFGIANLQLRWKTLAQFIGFSGISSQHLKILLQRPPIYT